MATPQAYQEISAITLVEFESQSIALLAQQEAKLNSEFTALVLARFVTGNMTLRSLGGLATSRKKSSH